MAGFYPYLISSLPSLQWGMNPPFDYARFIQLCRGLISDEDLAVLEPLDLHSVAEQPQRQPALAALRSCETALRNELVRLRSGRKKAEPQKYLRGDGAGPDSALHHSALAAFRNPSIIEGEKILDRQRWECAEEAAAGHYFDLDRLIVYAYQLLLLLKWSRAAAAPAAAAVEASLAQKDEVKHA